MNPNPRPSQKAEAPSRGIDETIRGRADGMKRCWLENRTLKLVFATAM
ncbi:MAG: hypothetical protein JRN51_11775 [Nitrososphaerota archaeon]|nr:hypothetical protein [Nitrososphaerota archaeon]